jgi:dienelactone hydrolase
MTRVALMAVVAVGGLAAAADVKSKKVEYKVGEESFAGVMYWDDASKDKRPGVVVFHEWWGLDDHAKAKAEELAKLGYVAFAADLYGDAKVVDTTDHAMTMATGLRKDPKVWRARALAAAGELVKFDKTDPTKLAAIGYCLGGTTALQLAATGFDLKAVSTFHAGLPKLTAEEAKEFKAKVLINTGADDKNIKAEAVDAFKKTLEDAKVKVEVQTFPGVVHSFTVKDADKRKMDNMKYDKDADEKSWAATKKLFDEQFGKK